jgi:DNA-binding response OmpR family regulator
VGHGRTVALMSITTTGPLEIREEDTDVLVDGRRVGLTVREFEVFLTLASRPDRVVQRPEVYQQVWNAPMPYRDRAVDVFVRKVRQKLEEAAPDWTFIHTHFGIGYRFSPEPKVK